MTVMSNTSQAKSNNSYLILFNNQFYNIFSHKPFIFAFFLNAVSTADFKSTTDPSSEGTVTSQKSTKYVVIGCSTFGGILALVIVAVLVNKCVLKHKVNPYLPNEQPGMSLEGGGQVDDALELKATSSKM